MYKRQGEYGHTPVPVKAEFREKITGSPVEVAYDTTTYKRPENPELAEFGGVKLAKNNEEALLLELLPNVANTYLRKRRKEEYDAMKATEAPAAAEAAAEAKVDMNAPVTGPVLTVPMPGTIVEIKVKPGDTVKKGEIVLIYEAMKMENDLEADKAGTVKRIFVNPGQAVAADAVVVEFE